MPRRRPKPLIPKDAVQQAHLEIEKHALAILDQEFSTRSTPVDQLADSRDAKPGNRWHKGMKSANPEGRRATMQRYIYELMTLARGYAPEMFVVLRRIALNPLVAPESRIKAATAVLDRAFGPPNTAFQILTQVNAPGTKDAGPGPQVNVNVTMESEMSRMAEIARVLDQSGALSAIAGLKQATPVEPVAIAAEPSPDHGESVRTEPGAPESSSSKSVERSGEYDEDGKG